jgi:putative peptidoglycan lipid II flippase
MAVGVLAGGFLQFAVQVPALWKLGWRPVWPPQLDHPGVRRIAFLMLPATIGPRGDAAATSSSTRSSASQLTEGSVSWLSYAFRLMQLPIGVFGVALATVSLPTLAKHAVENDVVGMRSTLSGAIRLVFALTLPATFGLWALSQPLVQLLYQHGRLPRRRHGPDGGGARRPTASGCAPMRRSRCWCRRTTPSATRARR